jgi:nucleoid DNA-binding protein
MSKRLGKVAIINRLELLSGIPREQSGKLLEALSEIVTSELSKGNAVTLHNVCTIRPKIVEEQTMPVAGVSTKIPQHLKLSVTISKTLKDFYKKEISEKGKLQKGVRELGDFFHKKP